MQTGANYYTVKINGQKFVDTYEYSELTCVARKNTINQSDREGMYEIVWADTGNSFKAGSDSSSGSLKALFDIRDGNNSENSVVPSQGLQQARLGSAIHPLQTSMP